MHITRLLYSTTTSVNYKSWGKGTSWTLLSLSIKWTYFPEGIPLSCNDLAFAGHKMMQQCLGNVNPFHIRSTQGVNAMARHLDLPKDGCKGQACPAASLLGGLSATLLQRLRSLGHWLACFQHPRKSSNTNPLCQRQQTFPRQIQKISIFSFVNCHNFSTLLL